jgi:hypothetical protein
VHCLSLLLVVKYEPADAGSDVEGGHQRPPYL